jgi:hypothetical protein
MCPTTSVELVIYFLFSGAFSNVYKAINLTTGEKVAGLCPYHFSLVHWLINVS